MKPHKNKSNTKPVSEGNIICTAKGHPRLIPKPLKSPEFICECTRKANLLTDGFRCFYCAKTLCERCADVHFDY